jgi:transaldolase / glucose-6-phosphate isomerase
LTKLHELTQQGQSIWLDFIRRQFVREGGLQNVVDQGIRGVTSNPTIFEKAITGSDDYDDDLRKLVAEGKSVGEIYEALAVQDIKEATDVLRPVYDESNGQDGYVSLEVSPTLARETEGTINEARRLYAAVDRPNLFIKVPATPAGVPAIQTLIGEGISVNVTLIFSIAQYEAIAEAYIAGLEKLAAEGKDLSKVASVASFFVSRVDGKLDPLLESTDLQGKIAIANARLAYARFQELFSGERWEKLAAKGAQVQRPLWASTSTKNPDYLDTLYVDTLIGPDTVNTMPPETLDATLDHATVARTVDQNVEEARRQIKRLKEHNIDLDQVTAELQDEGVGKFAQSFESLMAGIKDKRDRIRNGDFDIRYETAVYDDAIKGGWDKLRDEQIMHRIWSGDHTVWKPEPTEISNRLGWLNIADRMKNEIQRLHLLADRARKEGFTNVLLLGMGGSSLAPEVMARTLGIADGYLDLDVLDSTDPGAVLAYRDQLDPAKTLFIVATKSGGTAETLSFFKFFYNHVAEKLGKDAAGEHFIAITDPGSKLESIADRYHFRATFLNDPNIGGRYSALSFFGLIPAALMGVDLTKLLERAQQMAANCDAKNCPSKGDNNGGRIGSMIGTLAQAGRDKLTFITSDAFVSFGDWVEQLIAESTGKESKGILPVVGEPMVDPTGYSDDRVFVYLRLDDRHDAQVQALIDTGHPVIRVALDDVYDLGGQFFLWEMATAVAGYVLQINPFDQPNVEAAKKLARAMIAEYEQTGKLPEVEAAANPADALRQFVNEDGDYIALQAYIQPTAEVEAALQALRLKLLQSTHKATTPGFGPRFLHSTGQLHKGDAGNGLFVQFTADMPTDADIPDEAGEPDSAMSFGTLKMAQALGDRQALLDAGRQVLRIDLGSDPVKALKSLI